MNELLWSNVIDPDTIIFKSDSFVNRVGAFFSSKNKIDNVLCQMRGFQFDSIPSILFSF